MNYLKLAVMLLAFAMLATATSAIPFINQDPTSAETVDLHPKLEKRFFGALIKGVATGARAVAGLLKGAKGAAGAAKSAAGAIGGEVAVKKITETVTKESAEKAAKEFAEEGAKEAAERTAKKAAEAATKEATEKGAKEAAERVAKESTEKFGETAASTVAKEGTEAVTEQAAKTAVKEGGQAATGALATAAVKEGGEAAAGATARTVAKEGTEAVTEEAARTAVKEGGQAATGALATGALKEGGEAATEKLAKGTFIQRTGLTPKKIAIEAGTTLAATVALNKFLQNNAEKKQEQAFNGLQENTTIALSLASTGELTEETAAELGLVFKDGKLEIPPGINADLPSNAQVEDPATLLAGDSPELQTPKTVSRLVTPTKSPAEVQRDAETAVALASEGALTEEAATRLGVIFKNGRLELPPGVRVNVPEGAQEEGTFTQPAALPGASFKRPVFGDRDPNPLVLNSQQQIQQALDAQQRISQPQIRERPSFRGEFSEGLETQVI